jgi:hypothetical protein
MNRRVPLWIVALAALALAGVTVAQGYQPNFIRNLFSPIITGPTTANGDVSISGDAGISKNLNVGGTIIVGAIDAGNITVNSRLCTTPACTTNDISNDGFGSINIRGPFSGSNNFSASGTIQASGYLIPSGGIKNTGTAAPCTGTGSVCIDDTGGLEVTNGSGTTVASISAAGAAVLNGGATLGSGGTAIATYLSGTVAVTGASVTAGACAQQGTDITTTGAAAGDACLLGLSASPGNGLAYSCVAGTNKCQIFACNASAGNLTSLTGTHRCSVVH